METKNKIRVPVIVDGQEFYDSSLATALENCQEKHNALFMPEVIDARINASGDERIWQVWLTTPSVKVTGRDSYGKPRVVYAHIANYFSDPKNIRKAAKEGLRNGAGVYPQDEFQKLLDIADGNRVFAVDYETLINSSSGVISIKNALEHPQTIPFVGGKEKAQRYLGRHREIYGNSIGVWHTDDLDEVPRGRLLFAGYDYDGGLYGSGYLGGDGRFVGVSKSAEGASPEILASRINTEQLSNIINEYVATRNQNEVLERLKVLNK